MYYVSPLIQHLSASGLPCRTSIIICYWRKKNPRELSRTTLSSTDPYLIWPLTPAKFTIVKITTAPHENLVYIRPARFILPYNHIHIYDILSIDHGPWQNNLVRMHSGIATVLQPWDWTLNSGLLNPFRIHLTTIKRWDFYNRKFGRGRGSSLVGDSIQYSCPQPQELP